MEIREVRDDLAESDGIGLVTWPASRVLLKWLQSSDEAPAVQGATVLDYVLSILFFREQVFEQALRKDRDSSAEKRERRRGGLLKSNFWLIFGKL